MFPKRISTLCQKIEILIHAVLVCTHLYQLYLLSKMSCRAPTRFCLGVVNGTCPYTARKCSYYHDPEKCLTQPIPYKQKSCSGCKYTAEECCYIHKEDPIHNYLIRYMEKKRVHKETLIPRRPLRTYTQIYTPSASSASSASNSSSASSVSSSSCSSSSCSSCSSSSNNNTEPYGVLEPVGEMFWDSVAKEPPTLMSLISSLSEEEIKHMRDWSPDRIRLYCRMR